MRVVKAQTVRVNLFANAVATSMRRLPASILASHAPIGGPFRIARRITDIAPVINSRRLSRRSIFETRQSLAKLSKGFGGHWSVFVAATAHTKRRNPDRLQTLPLEVKKPEGVSHTSGQHQKWS